MTVSEVTSNYVVLSWNQSDSVQSVLVRYRATDSETTAMCEETYHRPRDNHVTVSGLSPFMDYEFFIVFDNGAGCSRASGPQYATTERSGTASYCMWTRYNSCILEVTDTLAMRLPNLFRVGWTTTEVDCMIYIRGGIEKVDTSYRAIHWLIDFSFLKGPPNGYHALNTSRSTLITDFYYFSSTNCVTSFMTFSPSMEFLN